MKLAILIVTFNSEKTIKSVLTNLQSENYDSSTFLLDNASKNSISEILNDFPNVTVFESEENLGFCAANNLLLNTAYRQAYSHFLFLNPDALPKSGAIEILINTAVQKSQIADAFSPKLLRATELMEPVLPLKIDAAGMYFTKNFRHLDRGSGQEDKLQYEDSKLVSGGTGAALLVSRSFVEKISFKKEDGSFEFFDERFFAYREDAELALRATRYGLKYLYVPQSVFYHVRKVVPENRSELPAFLNALSVRNRLLLLISHYSFKFPLNVQLAILLRNILVFAYALLFEKESREHLFGVLGSLGLHLSRRREIRSKSIVANYSRIFE